MDSEINNAALKLRGLRLPSAIDRVWSCGEPRRFCIQWSRPDTFVSRRKDLIALCSRLKYCIPILESFNERIVGYDTNAQEFIEYAFGDSECHVIGRSYQQCLSWIFVELGYSGLADIVRDVALEFGYRHLDKYLTFIETGDDLPSEESRRLFVSSILD